MVGSAALMVRPFLLPERPPHIDTTLENGSHLIIVVVAPTRMTKEFAAYAAGAIDSMRSASVRHGLLFGTIGVSDNLWVARGLRDLREISEFDEVIVGRNWLNHGITKYITDMHAKVGVPQVIVLLQAVDFGTNPFTMARPEEVFRVVGLRELAGWSEAGYPVEIDNRSTRVSMVEDAELR